MNSCAAISLVVRPLAISLRICRSRGVSRTGALPWPCQAANWCFIVCRTNVSPLRREVSRHMPLVLETASRSTSYKTGCLSLKLIPRYRTSAQSYPPGPVQFAPRYRSATPLSFSSLSNLLKRKTRPSQRREKPVTTQWQDCTIICVRRCQRPPLIVRKARRERRRWRKPGLVGEFCTFFDRLL